MSNNKSIGTGIPAATLLASCQIAKKENFTHTIITQKDGVDEIIDIKLPPREKFFKYMRKILPKGTSFRFLDLAKDFEEEIRKFHPGAKALACEG
jgi:hypothetical protein